LPVRPDEQLFDVAGALERLDELRDLRLRVLLCVARMRAGRRVGSVITIKGLISSAAT
jgi:hypothetical protein